MKYAVSRCPTCSGPPVAELNTVPVFAGLVEGWKRGRESCAAFNAACLAGESPALGDCLFDQVVMSGLGGGDESQGSPDVKGPWDSSVLGRGVPVGTGAKQPRGMQHKANIAAPSDPPQGAD